MKYSHLFEPLKVNTLILKNRVLLAPMGYADPVALSEQALGGPSLITIGSAQIDEESSNIMNQPYPFSKGGLTRLREQVVTIRQAGAKASLELIHGGQFAGKNYISSNYAIGPMALIREDGLEVKAMDEPMMYEVAERYANAAKEAQAVGFDMIMLHFAHGWLPAQFLSPHFNKRTDQYGGSLENRARFPKMIIERVRSAIGKDFAVELRISGYEWIDESIEIGDVISFVKSVENLIDMVHVSAGMDGAGIDEMLSAHCHMMTTTFEPHMANVWLAERVKKAVNIPVVTVGAIMHPDEAEDILSTGKADAVAIARAVVADPLWSQKALEGKGEEITPCLRCLSCSHVATRRRNSWGCAVNPRHGREAFVSAVIEKAPVIKNVVVIGGGPGGMEAAITARQRGHTVTLLEKSGELGGNIKFSEYDKLKLDLKLFKDYLIRTVKQSGAAIKLNTEATPEMVREMHPDVIIVAVGANPITPNIKGIKIEKKNVMQSIEAYPNLEKIGKRVVVIGGGYIGCEISLELALREHEVTIIEISDVLASNGNRLYKEALHQKMATCTGLQYHLETVCTEIQDNGVVIQGKDGVEKRVETDTVILATGFKANRTVAEAFYGITYETYLIGDCERARKVDYAINEGYFIGRNI